MLSEIAWEAHDSSLFLCLEQSEHDGEPKGIFTPGLWGGLPQEIFPHQDYEEDHQEETFSNLKSLC